MQTSTTRFSKAARTPEIIRCTAPKWRGYDRSKVNIIKLGKHWSCFNKIYSAQLTRSGSFRPWKRCHFRGNVSRLTTWKWRRVTKEIFAAEIVRGLSVAPWSLPPHQWSATCTVRGEARVSCDGHFSLGKISLEKGLSSRKSTVKFFRWAAFTTLSKAKVERRLSLGPKRPTNYLSRSNKNDDCGKIWAKPTNFIFRVLG